MSTKPLVVRVEQLEPRPTAVVKRTAAQADLPKVIPAAVGVVWNLLRARGIPNTGLNMALYHDMVMNIETGVLVNGPFTPEGEVICSELPGGPAATAAFFGPYSRLGEAHGAVVAWCDAQGMKRTGVSWEVYGHWDDDPAKLRTDVYYQLA